MILKILVFAISMYGYIFGSVPSFMGEALLAHYEQTGQQQKAIMQKTSLKVADQRMQRKNKSLCGQFVEICKNNIEALCNGFCKSKYRAQVSQKKVNRW